MIIEFAITNFRSIKERQVFSMLPSERVKERKNPNYMVSAYKDLQLLTVAAIFGQNSGGKSNLIKAFKALEWLVLQSHRFTQGDKIHANEAFVFDINFESKPTIFEIDFIANNQKRYLYQVEVTQNQVIREELYYYVRTETGKNTKRKLFIRKLGSDISYGDDFKGGRKSVEERTRPNVLFLSKSISENNTFLEPIFEFFKTGFQVSDFSAGYIDLQIRYFAKMSEANHPNELQLLTTALKNIDTGILNLTTTKSENLPKNIRIKKDLDEQLDEKQQVAYNELIDLLKMETHTEHRLFDGGKAIGTRPLPLKEESEGTQKFIAVFSTLMQSIQTGSAFIVDEFDKSFHPLLTKVLVRMILNPKINVNGAQLIFSTHDVNVMDLLEHDQINLVQKDVTGATEVYVVSDIRGLRGDLATAKRYLRGELESIPNIDETSIYETLENY